MAIDINGYNETFKAFTDFAAQRIDAGKGATVARASADVTVGALAGRSAKASDTDSVRGMFKWFRSSDDKAANDATRKIFRDAIIDMFGGESKIPESVKKAMVLADYDKGKPLTARQNLPGIEKMVSRDATSGKYTMMTTDKKEGEPIRYDLTVSEDGESATLTVTDTSNLVTGTGKNELAVYGTVKSTMSFQINMTGEKPVITSTSIGQEFAAA